MKILKQYLDLDIKEGWLAERSSASIIIGECYFNLNDFKNANKYFMNAFDISQGWREPLIKAARLCQKTDEFRKGIALAHASLGLESIDGFSEDTRNYTVVPVEILYWGYYWTGKKEIAKKYRKLCLDIEPNNSKYNEDAKFFKDIKDIDEVKVL
jgi:tetratricopeptide (TPR) repeat protein